MPPVGQIGVQKIRGQLSRYTSGWPPVNAALLAFAAKLRAETAPSIGNESDLFVITKDGGYVSATPQQVTDVREILGRKRVRDKESEQNAFNELDVYIKSLSSPPPPGNQAISQHPPATTDGSPRPQP